MNRLLEILRQLQFRWLGRRFDADLAEEMRLHLDLRAEEGQDPDTARRRFGNTTLLREQSREAWGWTSLDTWFQDLRYAVRTFAASKGFVATVVLSLALGIGANTAIFSILNAVILRSLPVEDPRGLVEINLGGGDPEVTNPIWEQVRDHQQAFSGALAYAQDVFDLAAGGEKHLAQGMFVSGEFFRVLGVPAIRGRVFTAEDDHRGARPLAVISNGFWKRNYASDPDIVGKSVRLNRHWFTIVGVTPAWFTGLENDRPYDVAFPLACEPILNPERSALDNKLTWFLHMVGRVPPGVTLQQAQDRLRSIAPEVFRATLPEELTPGAQQHYRENNFTLKQAAAGFSETGQYYRTALLTLMAIVGLVLLIACANVANLLLARSSARQRELSVRMAMGAGRWRVVRQLITESVLLAAFGSAAGFVLALWGSRLLVRLISTTARPVDIDVSPDPRVLAFTIVLTVLTALLFGFVPAVRATGFGLNQVLKENVRQAVHGASRLNLGKLLVLIQVGLSLMLLVGAGLFLGTLRNMLTADTGFTRQHVLLINADIGEANIAAARRMDTFSEILNRLRAIRGVESAALSRIAPMSRIGWAQPVQPEGYQPQSQRDTLVFFNRVSAGYFKTMGTPMLLGRDFNDHDTLTAPGVLIIAESTARHFFGTANPIGKSIGLDEPGRERKGKPYRVIGVVKDAKYNRVNEPLRQLVYLADMQDPEPETQINFELRSSGPAEAMIGPSRTAIAQINKDVSLIYQSFENEVKETMSQARLVAWLSSAFALLALVLAMVGLYGVTAYSVTRRTGEIGIRMALGAQRSAVLWLVMRDVVGLLAAGILIGLAGALASGRLVTSLLYGIRPNDPWQLAAAVLTLAVGTALASYLPARRASRLDPMHALRDE